MLPADAADLRLLPRERTAVFVVATAGQGEFPANCRGLWKFLARASLPSGCLSGLKVAVFGFGDSGYPLFNAAARKLHRRLVEGLGASPLVPLGLGDDQSAGGGPDAALDAWLRELWPALRATTIPLPEGVPDEVWGEGEGEVGRLGPCRFSVELVSRCEGAAPSPPSPFLPTRMEALEAHAAFHRLDALASGELAAPPGYEGESEGEGSGEGGCSGSGPASPLLAAAALNSRLTPRSHWQDTRHLSLRITSPTREPGKSHFYSPGDVAAFLPEQSAESVRRVLALSGLGPRDRVRVSAAASFPSSAPSPRSLSFETSAAALVAGVLELDGASPRRRLFEVLAAFSSAAPVDVGEEGEEEAAEASSSSGPDPPASLARERLRLFASPEGRADLALYCGSAEPRTLSEVLSDFPSAARSAPLAWLLSAAPRLRPRRFSIASAPSLEEGGETVKLDLTVAVVRYHTPHGRPRLGLASGWLSRLGAAAEEEKERSLPLWVERGALSLPSLAAAAARQMKSLNRQPLLPPLEAWLATPLILIGPGTGIAPMRSLLQARRAEKLKNPGAVVAPCSLYFGCRSPAADCYYRGEFDAMVGDGTLRAYLTAFSREEVEEEEGEEERGAGKDGEKKKMKPKRYVTHLLREDADDLWRLLSPPADGSSNSLPAMVLVAGSAKNMPRDVRLVFEDFAAEQGGLGVEGGKAFLRKMVSSGRYVVEAWS